MYICIVKEDTLVLVCVCVCAIAQRAHVMLEYIANFI